MKKLLLLALLLPHFLSAQVIRGASMLHQSSPTITEVGSFDPFNTALGSFSSPQIVTIAGQNLIDNITLQSSVTGMEFSTDNFTYTSPKTVFRVGTVVPGQPISIYTRIAQSAAAGTTSGFINISSSGASTVQVPYVATVTASSPQAQYFFTLTSKTVAGWNDMYFPSGNTTTIDIQATDASTGWTLKTHHTNWGLLFGQYFASNSDGGSDTPDSTYGTEFPAAVVAGTFINGEKRFVEMTDGLYPFSWDNLPAGTYQIDIMCSEKLSIIGTQTYADVHIKFGSTGDNIYTSGTFASGTNPILWPFASNTNKVLRFTGTITAGQSIRWGIFENFGISDFSVVSATTIKKVG